LVRNITNIHRLGRSEVSSEIMHVGNWWSSQWWLCRLLYFGTWFRV